MNFNDLDFRAVRTAHRALCTKLTELFINGVQSKEPAVQNSPDLELPHSLLFDHIQNANSDKALAELSLKQGKVFALATEIAALFSSQQPDAAKSLWLQFQEEENIFHNLLDDLESNGKFDKERPTSPQQHDTVLSRITSEHQVLYEFFMQAPAMFCILKGPEHVMEMTNPRYEQLIGNRNVTGLPIREALPELVDQGFFELLDNVYASGQPHIGTETPVTIETKHGEELSFLNFIYQPILNKEEKTEGILVFANDVSEQVRYRHETEASEERFRTLIEEAPVPMCLYSGPDLKIEIANDALLNLWGRDKSVIGINLLQALPELANQPFPRLLKEVFDTGQQYVAKAAETSVLINGKLETYYFDLWYNPIREATGEIYGVLATGVDITEKVQARQRIEVSENKFRKMVQYAPIAIAFTNGKNHVFDGVNAPMMELMGQSESVIGKPLLEVLPALGSQNIVDILSEVYETGKPFHGNEVPVILTENGSTNYYNISYTPMMEMDGVAGIIHVAVDVTEQVTSRRKLEEGAQQLRSLVESAPFPIGVYHGREMRIALANQSIIDTWDKGDVVGKLYSEVLPELDNQDIYPQLDHVFMTGIPFHAKNQRVDLVVDGRLQSFYFNYSFTPLRHADGTVYGVMNTAADVTDLNVAKLQVEESESRFRNLIILAPVGICIVQGENQLVETVNENFLQLIGKSKTEVEHKNLWESIPEVAPIYSPILQKVFDTGIGYKATEHKVTMTRHEVPEDLYLSFVYEPLKDEVGGVKAVMIVAMDVTTEVNARNRIEEGELRWKRLTNVVPAFIFTATPEGTISFVSDKFLEFTGLGFEEAIGESHFETIHPNDRLANQEKWQRSMTTRKVFENEVRWKHRNGEYRWVVVRAEPVKDHEGNIISWIASGMDISELKKVQQELVESESRFRSMADAMPQLVWTSTPGGKFNYFNQAAIDYTGLNHAQLEDDGWLNILNAEEQGASRDHWIASMESGKDFIYHHRFRGKDGDYRWQLSRAVPQRDIEGNIKLWIGTSTDIHAQKTISQDLEKMVQERTQELLEVNYDLERSNEELKQFAYIASHDLQEPLRKIITFSNRLNDLDGLPSTGAVYLDKISVSAKRMSHLINDLLDFSSTTRNSTSFEPTNLSELLYELLSDFELEIQNKHALIEIGELPVVMAMNMQMTQLFHNLLSNALKFTRPGVQPVININAQRVLGNSIANQVSADRSTEYWEIIVEDNGIGFDQKFSEQIFAIFQRLHGKSTFEGTGIGLALCRRIVDNHNGFIIGESAPGEGAKFRIFLPAV
ncbi:MAG: PAS domain S-box protein [Ferruginibacter sp.]|nr:PAS domain S-box protein [Ferruginibacter sp.]